MGTLFEGWHIEERLETFLVWSVFCVCVSSRIIPNDLQATLLNINCIDAPHSLDVLDIYALIIHLYVSVLYRVVLFYSCQLSIILALKPEIYNFSLELRFLYSFLEHN